MNDDLIAKIKSRIAGHYEFLQEQDFIMLKEHKYLDAGTPERAYWHHGYMVACKDILRHLTLSAPASAARPSDDAAKPQQ